MVKQQNLSQDGPQDHLLPPCPQWSVPEPSINILQQLAKGEKTQKQKADQPKAHVLSINLKQPISVL